MKPSSRNTALVVVLLVVLAVGAAVWMSQRDLRATDDAFVDADIVTVTAEASGLVQAVHVADNAQVTRGAALVDLDSEDLKLRLFQIGGDPAGLGDDGQERLAGAGQAFSLLPPENASGNFVKLVQRVPVKLVFDTPPGRPLAPGLSARLTIHVR